jgi:hypothetical protein
MAACVLRMPITREIALAAATDAGDRNMQAGGRKAWSEEDFNVATDTLGRLWYEPKEALHVRRS